jgi:hypothetical protein
MPITYHLSLFIKNIIINIYIYLYVFISLKKIPIKYLKSFPNLFFIQSNLTINMNNFNYLKRNMIKSIIILLKSLKRILCNFLILYTRHKYNLITRRVLFLYHHFIIYKSLLFNSFMTIRM